MLLSLSRRARSLSKEATSVPDIPGLTGSSIAADKAPHGLQGRLSRQGGSKPVHAKKMEAPRAYGPRISAQG